jgi:hypothetical protein
LRPWIVSGLVLSAGTGLNVAISAGVAWIDGYYVEWDASAEEAVTGSATNHVWIELTRDVNDNVTAVDFVVNTTGVAPTGDNVKLGVATTDGSSVTGVATTGRSPETQVLVESVFGRGGIVVAASGDYDADEVDYDNATSGLVATDVQAAVDELAARPAPLGYDALIVKTADETLAGNGNNTLQNDDELFFSVGANKTYFVELAAYCESTSSDGFKLDFTGPSGATMNAQISRVARNSTAQSVFDLYQNIAIATTQSITLSGSNEYWLNCAIILTTSSTAGTFQFRWSRDGTGNGGNGIVYKGSVFRYKDIT